MLHGDIVDVATGEHGSGLGPLHGKTWSLRLQQGFPAGCGNGHDVTQLCRWLLHVSAKKPPNARHAPCLHSISMPGVCGDTHAWCKKTWKHIGVNMAHDTQAHTHTRTHTHTRLHMLGMSAGAQSLMPFSVWPHPALAPHAEAQGNGSHTGPMHARECVMVIGACPRVMFTPCPMDASACNDAPTRTCALAHARRIPNARLTASAIATRVRHVGAGT